MAGGMEADAIDKVKELTGEFEGEYVWQLCHTVEGPAEDEIEWTETRETDSKEITSELVRRDETISSSFGTSASTGGKFKLIDVSCKSDASYSAGSVLAKEMRRSTETNTRLSSSFRWKKVRTVPAGETRCLWQLMFRGPGFCYTLENTLWISPDAPKPPLEEKAVFSYRIAPPRDEVMERATRSAFVDLLHLLSRIEPGRDNKGEWSAIRDTCVSLLRTASDPSAGLPSLLDSLLDRLSTITPGRDNIGEWETIRSRTSALRTDNTLSSRQRLFALLDLLSSITPGSSNCGEWSTIRSHCHKAKPTLIID